MAQLFLLSSFPTPLTNNTSVWLPTNSILWRLMAPGSPSVEVWTTRSPPKVGLMFSCQPRGEKGSVHYSDVTMSEMVFQKAPVPLWRIVVRINANDIACGWRRFFLKNWGFVPGLSLCRTRTIDNMIIYESMRIRHELNTNWCDAVRCNKMQHDGDTMQYEAVRWWWRINTIALRCDENTICTNRNLQEPMRTCAIQCDNAIVAHRIATYWVTADRRRIPVRVHNESIRMYNDEIRTNRNWHELIRRSAMQYDAIRIGFDSQGQYECF